MIRMTSKFARFGLALVVFWALAGCSESKPSPTTAVEPTAAAVNKDPSTEPSVVIDDKEWMRCSLGQNWDGKGCVGDAKVFSFDGAADAASVVNTSGFDGKNDWRVPTIHELQTLRVCSSGFGDNFTGPSEEFKEGCNEGSTEPAINLAIFPLKVDPESPLAYWSSTKTPRRNMGWYVVFSKGFVGWDADRDSLLNVRLVRAKQSGAGSSSSEPAGTATVVIDSKEWMRCSLGQTWDGFTCSGQSKKFSFVEAQAAAKELNAKGGAHGKNDWRLPSVRELANLRVCSAGLEGEMDVRDGSHPIAEKCKGEADLRPTLDLETFPTAPADFFWSSTSCEGLTYCLNGGMSVLFNGGLLTGAAPYGLVRLVRSSQ